jgi:predicted patatin/cPLA2 family phospholipase
MNNPNISYDTLVLPGGATKGLILLGAIQCAVDKLLCTKIVNYIGTSVGSMIGYLLAIGYTPVEIIVYICTNGLIERMQCIDLVSMIKGTGASEYSYIQTSLEKMTLKKIGKYLTLKELQTTYGKTLISTTYNRTRAVTEYVGPDNYPELPCLIAIRMSCNLPLLFEKFKYMGCEYVDGGISNNFPILIGENIGKKVLGFTLSPQKVIIPDDNENMLVYLYTLLSVPVNQSTQYIISLATEKSTIIVVPSGDKQIFDFNINSSSKLNMFSSGYQCVSKSLSV